MDPRQVTMDDLLRLLGQSTVELAYLRARVLELEHRLHATEAHNEHNEHLAVPAHADRS